MFLFKVILILMLFIFDKFESENLDTPVKLYGFIKDYQQYKIDDYFEKRQFWVTSNLGSLLFKNKNEQFGRKNKTFLIMFWNFWPWQRRRNSGDIFANCSVRNCKLTTDLWDMAVADAVVVFVQFGLLPLVTKSRPIGQRWIFWVDESPINMFIPKIDIKTWANIFNWTMTYRTDSDVPVPYGRTLPLDTPYLPRNISYSLTSLIPNWEIKRKDVYVVAMMSHCCVIERNNYIKELQQHIRVDFYGKCSPYAEYRESCPGRFTEDCPLINKYLFFLAFENSKCRQYITEKTFYNSFLKGSIPIIMGAPKLDCERILPPHSFLHVDDFPNPKSLANEVKRLARSKNKLLMYHEWRRFFKVTNEHGYFGTHGLHMCRVCEALNYNDEKPKVYDADDLKMFADSGLLCKLSVYKNHCA